MTSAEMPGPVSAESSIELLAERAQVLLQLRRAPEAEREARAALAKDPHNPAGHLLLGLALLLREDSEEALAAANRGIGLVPTHWIGHWVAGVILAAGGRPHEALDAFRNALALGPEEPTVHEALARVHLAIGEPRIAAAAAEQGLKLAPEDPKLTELMAIALAQLKDKAGARHYASAAIQLAPEAPGAHRAYGLVMLLAGDRRAGADSLREAVRLAPDDPDGPSLLLAALRHRNPLRRLDDFLFGIRRIPRRNLLWWFVGVLFPPVFAVTILLTLAVWVNWVAQALTTLSIRRERYLFSDWEVRAARVAGGLLGGGVVLLGFAAGFQSTGLVMAGVALLGLITPVQETTLLTGTRRFVVGACAVALALAQAVLLTLAFLGHLTLIPSLLTLYSSLASTWPAILLQPRARQH